MRLKFKLGDMIVIIVIVLSAVLVFFMTHTKNTALRNAIITQNNVILKKIRLDNLSQNVHVDYFGNYPGTIEAQNGRIRFLHAKCPDQVCVHTGWITRPGQIAVCLPAKVIVKIEGVSSDLDIMLK